MNQPKFSPAETDKIIAWLDSHPAEIESYQIQICWSDGVITSLEGRSSSAIPTPAEIATNDPETIARHYPGFAGRASR